MFEERSNRRKVSKIFYSIFLFPWINRKRISLDSVTGVISEKISVIYAEHKSKGEYCIVNRYNTPKTHQPMRMQHSDNENKDVNLDLRLDSKCMNVRLRMLADLGVSVKTHRFFSGLSFPRTFDVESLTCSR